MNYCKYENHDSITHEQLITMNREKGALLARAEISGCEGCYTEVAKWSCKHGRWERFCFVKFLGGEDSARPDYTPVSLAEHYAREINEAVDPFQVYLPLIHGLPNAT